MARYKKAALGFLEFIGLTSYNKYKQVEEELTHWKKAIWKPGHYYSPIPAAKDISETISIDYNQKIPGVDLNEEYQFTLLEQLSSLYDPNIFPINESGHFRYYFDNDYFGFSDGIFLSSVIRYFRPKKIIEIGSGFSSALMLDTKDKYSISELDLNFIEPYPEERLHNLISKNEYHWITKEFVQSVPLEKWSELAENDILFIDSSHVSKVNSDVNYLFLEVLPRLRKGVIVHIHDIFFPFEYPLEWLKQGRAWNEAYLLRAFLQFNSDFKIILFTSFLEGKYKSWFEKNMPLCLKTHKTIQVDGKTHNLKTTGQSIYLRKEN
jgi:predicted O-methyltransferase YrrM